MQLDYFFQQKKASDDDEDVSPEIKPSISMADESLTANGSPKRAAAAADVVDAWSVGIAASVADLIGHTPMVQLNRVSAGAGARVGLFFVAFA
jgi:hypothetical protein